MVYSALSNGTCNVAYCTAYSIGYLMKNEAHSKEEEKSSSEFLK